MSIIPTCFSLKQNITQSTCLKHLVYRKTGSRQNPSGTSLFICDCHISQLWWDVSVGCCFLRQDRWYLHSLLWYESMLLAKMWMNKAWCKQSTGKVTRTCFLCSHSATLNLIPSSLYWFSCEGKTYFTWMNDSILKSMS